MYLFTDIMSDSVYTHDKSESLNGGLSCSEMDVNNIQVLSDEDYIRYTDDISAASYTVNDMSSANMYDIMDHADELYFSDNDQDFMSEYSTNSPDENMVASIPPEQIAIKSTIENKQNGFNENENHVNANDYTNIPHIAHSNIQQHIAPSTEKNDVQYSTGNESTVDLKRIYESRNKEQNKVDLYDQDLYENDHQNEEKIQIEDLQTNRTFQGK